MAEGEIGSVPLVLLLRGLWAGRSFRGYGGWTDAGGSSRGCISGVQRAVWSVEGRLLKSRLGIAVRPKWVNPFLISTIRFRAEACQYDDFVGIYIGY